MHIRTTNKSTAPSPIFSEKCSSKSFAYLLRAHVPTFRNSVFYLNLENSIVVATSLSNTSDDVPTLSVAVLWVMSTLEEKNVDILNPSNAKATFDQSIRTQRSLKTFFSLNSSHFSTLRCQSFSHFFLAFLHYFVLAKLATCSIRVKILS